MQNKYIILGCGGHAKSIADVLLFNESNANIIFVDENARDGETIYNFSVVKDYKITDEKVFVAIGDNEKRAKIAEKYKNNLVNIISKDSYIGKDAKIKENACIFIGHKAYIGPLSKIEDFVVINTSASIDHECIINKGATIAPNATLCGKVIIDFMTWVGAGSIIKENTKITNNTIIGAGAVVVKDINEKGTYVGCPARIIKN